MPEENNENQAPQNGSGGGPAGGEGTTMTLEEAMAEIANLRKENAAKRVRNRAAEAELAEFNKWKESQMSEAERLSAARDSALEELRAERVESACNKFNVPAERRQFVTGNTKEEIELAAKVLGDGENSSQQEPPKPNTNLFPGTRGNPVGSSGTGKTFDDILRAKLR